MTPFALENENNATTFVFEKLEWPETNAYRCHICLIHEEDSVSAIVLNLPGAGSCGATEEESLANVEEAIRGMIDSYKKDGEKIPWQNSDTNDVPDDAKLIWILVNAD